MSFDFDQIIPRRGSGSAKWEIYPEDVLPMWVADMDFPSPAPVIRALSERAAHGFFGYAMPPQRLAEVICERLERRYRWAVTPEQIVYLPSLVSGINVVCRAIGEPGDHVLTLTPAYPPFLSAPGNHGRNCDVVELGYTSHEGRLRYAVDFDALAAGFHERTRLFLLCNPHNPVGMTYGPAELRRLAELCAERNVVICSDEIHCDLLLGETTHTPLASLDPAIAERTITLMAPSKTFNLPGLGCSMAIISNPELRKQVQQAEAGIVPHVTAMGYAGALAAYSEGGPWLEALLPYLTENRDLYTDFVHERMPQIAATSPAATYLGWLDCREAGVGDNPYQFFLDNAKVALSSGAMFGKGGQGFVRLNFACPRPMLLEGLERMADALRT